MQVSISRILAISILDTFMVNYGINSRDLNCGFVIVHREQQRKLSMLQMELEKAKKEGFVSKHLIETKGTDERKKLLAVVGIFTGFGRRHNRDAIRKAWMPTGRIPFPFVSFILSFLVNVLLKLRHFTIQIP